MPTAAVPRTVRRWHAVVASRDPSALHALLAPDAVFRSPAVHAPQEGRGLTFGYLAAALAVLGPTLRYHREFYAPDGEDGTGGAVLEFTATLGDRDVHGVDVHGVDVIGWDAAGLITDFSVMVRPLRGLERLVELMREQLPRPAA